VLEILRESYECAEAGSAEEALATLQAERFDLVLTDINMGGMSGLEMIPHALASAPNIVVMMISGEQTIEGAIEALRLGAFDYIQKPFDIKHVEAAVRRALEHRSLLEAKRLYESHLEETLRQRTEELNHLAFHDALTDLPNRFLFEGRLTQALVPLFGLVQESQRHAGTRRRVSSTARGGRAADRLRPRRRNRGAV
jgi:PleD family two-component response regulator